MKLSILRSHKILGLAAAAALVFTGCFEYTEEIEINQDGSGTLTVHATIDAEAAAGFRGELEGEKVPPPVSIGAIRDRLVGSSQVRLQSDNIRLEGENWVYDVVVSFENIEALGSIRYLDRRNIRYGYPEPKKIRLSMRLQPDIVREALDAARTYESDPYAEKFIEAASEENFIDRVANAPMTYRVTMQGAGGVGNADEIRPLPDDRVRGTWEYKAGEIVGKETPRELQLTATLPPERGFTPLVVIVLLASVAGILVPAIRLVILKVRGLG